MEFSLLTFCLVVLSAAIFIDAEEEMRYKFILDEVRAEKEAEDVGKVRVELIRSEDGVKINGEVEQLVDLDNTWKVQIVLKGAAAANEEYKDIMALPLMGVCDFMKIYYRMYLYESLVKYSNAPSPYVCPVVKATYILKEYPLISDRFKKLLPPGFYRTEASLYHDDEEKIKYHIEGHVVVEEE